MRRLSVSFYLIGFVLLLHGSGISQQLLTTEKPSPGIHLAGSRPAQPTPSSPSSVQLSKLQFIGMYQPDGAFTQSATSVRTAKFSNADGAPPRRNYASRLAEVPRFINLDAGERVVANFRPPYRASSPAKGHSLLASFRDKIVLMAYGRRSLLRAPTHIITDSQQRIIISDPDLQAVHVLDQTGRSAFRIAGGPQHRFQSADAIAVDAEDSIFIADGQNGTVEVFDRDGQFLRTIGMFKGERRFEKPTAIAINQKKALLYVLDGPANEVFVCDLEGNLVQRVSNRTKSGINFVYPTEIAVLEDRIFIIDDVGSRVQVFDSSFNPRSSFRVKVHRGAPVLTEIGLAADASGRIYLSNLFPDQIAVFEEDGRLVGLFGHSGDHAEEFRVPSGLWIDSGDRIYIADTDNSRVQVFRTIDTPTPAASSATESETSRPNPSR